MWWNENGIVVPHAGTWIEMKVIAQENILVVVVPHAGTWIEIGKTCPEFVRQMSFPTRERGLKLEVLHHQMNRLGRSPRGNVD